jgi:hypothetical protein
MSLNLLDLSGVFLLWQIAKSFLLLLSSVGKLFKLSRSGSIGHFHDFTECCGVNDCHLCQHFAVDFDIGFLHVADQSAVARAVLAGCSIDPSNPQAAEIAFPFFAIAITVTQGLHHPLVSCAELFGLCASESLG